MQESRLEDIASDCSTGRQEERDIWRSVVAESYAVRTPREEDEFQPKDTQAHKNIDQLINELGDPKFSVRQAASKSLVALGDEAFAAVAKASTHVNAEIATRS